MEYRGIVLHAPVEYHQPIVHHVPVVEHKPVEHHAPAPVEYHQPMQHYAPAELHQPMIQHAPVEHYQPMVHQAPVQHYQHQPMVQHAPVEHQGHSKSAHEVPHMHGMSVEYELLEDLAADEKHEKNRQHSPLSHKTSHLKSSRPAHEEHKYEDEFVKEEIDDYHHGRVQHA